MGGNASLSCYCISPSHTVPSWKDKLTRVDGWLLSPSPATVSPLDVLFSAVRTNLPESIRASTNFQILEVLNFLPLKFGGSTENFQEVPVCDAILSKLIDMYFMFVLFLGHLQQNIHEFTMIVAFMGIFIVLF